MTIAFGIGGGVTLLAVLATLLPPAGGRIVQIGSKSRARGCNTPHVAWEFFPPFLVGSLVGAVSAGLSP